MKSSRMKFAKKLKSFRAGEYLNQDRILQVLSAAEDGISEFLPKISNPIPQITAAGSIWRTPQKPGDQIANVKEELVENERKGGGEEASRSVVGDKENVRPPVNQIPRVPCDRKESKSEVSNGYDKAIGSGFRRPDLNSSTLFDPNLLEAFELAAVCFKKIDDFSRVDDEENHILFPVEEEIEKDENTLPPVIRVEEDRRKEENVNALQLVNVTAEGVIGEDGDAVIDPFLEFDERCPPGGEESVVFYTTTLRGIRKTFDDCDMIRFLLDSFKVKYYERDVSMHREYREELRRISAADETEVLPPVLFVKGRCIGGAQRVLGLHEQGKFKVLFEGVPIAGDERCLRCDGFRFLMCDGCRGSRRIINGDGSRIQCLICNENGLVVCVDCCSS
ncbi:PREDICTED: glutaredoxin domain-containing cysteine-rich protein 1-like [Camelina sativa]|uniref:Glutaredoxin domain-containing cysteine-rich protein 1-like n=1 Tax=Camelina sativa TaxID=90675 RepID=A0ABM0V755_CAMSA|nr:PREDICTED: glutaredoxin domain-containing cysteine-rich protein 1-like [Camelina sativa]